MFEPYMVASLFNGKMPDLSTIGLVACDPVNVDLGLCVVHHHISALARWCLAAHASNVLPRSITVIG